MLGKSPRSGVKMHTRRQLAALKKLEKRAERAAAKADLVEYRRRARTWRQDYLTAFCREEQYQDGWDNEGNAVIKTRLVGWIGESSP